MAGRPPIWAPFRQVHWLAEYEYAADGRMRDRSRNVLQEHSPDHRVTIRLPTGERRSFDKRELLALEWHGRPPRTECRVCGKRLAYRVVHLNGDRANASRDNVKWQLDGSAVWQHARVCLRSLINQRPSGTAYGRDLPPGVHAPECRCARCGDM